MENKLKKLLEKILIDDFNINAIVELTPARGHGDFSTNIALKNAKLVNKSPIEFANELIEKIKADFIKNVEVAGPGFINVFLNSDVISSRVEEIISKGPDFGRHNQKKKINIEFVSANPTGFLHLGHARGAAIGSTLVNILRFAGNKVDAEYYINDAGNQIDILGHSSWVRYKQALGENEQLPENSYRGEDIKECANYLLGVFGDKYKSSSYDEVKEIFKKTARSYLLEVIKKHLLEYRVEFDFYSSELDIYNTNAIEVAFKKLDNYIYEHDGAKWLKTTLGGDDKDRVLVKNDKTLTYFSPDIAYHNLKLSRHYDELINIWGADHIGYIKRLEVALAFLGLPKEKVDIFTVQLVKLYKNGQELKMSKRSGNTFTLLELIQEVGVDAARWFMIDRSPNSEFIFDIDIATSKDNDNPVFTVQYTHARANQLIEKSSVKPKAGKYSKQEVELANTLFKFEELINTISSNHKVHLLPQYLIALSQEFNSWYSNTKMIGNDNEPSMKALVIAVKQILQTGLTLLGISAPNKM